MGTERECVCCHEVEDVKDKLGEESKECITTLSAFAAVCLQADVLETAYYHYRAVYGQEELAKSQHERFRYTAYRQFVMWIYHHLGKSIRVVLPSCVVNRIRVEYPSENFTGFKLPQLE